MIHSGVLAGLEILCSP